ncbi:hypothetical protein AB0D90_34620, partial [Streptomyces althioticus]|uniref:hypothetical protein n=1 Tax=Streptomyces althioticus TaxID=83380 RepID=UPI0033E9F1A8
DDQAERDGEGHHDHRGHRQRHLHQGPSHRGGSHGEIDGVATSFMDFDCVTNACSELRDTRTVALSTWDYTLRLLTSPSW